MLGVCFVSLRSRKNDNNLISARFDPCSRGLFHHSVIRSVTIKYGSAYIVFFGLWFSLVLVKNLGTVFSFARVMEDNKLKGC